MDELIKNPPVLQDVMTLQVPLAQSLQGIFFWSPQLFLGELALPQDADTF